MGRLLLEITGSIYVAAMRAVLSFLKVEEMWLSASSHLAKDTLDHCI